MRAKKGRAAVRECLSLLAAAAVLFPVIYAFLGAFKEPEEFAGIALSLLPRSFSNTENFVRVFAMIPVARLFFNSFLTAALTCAVRLCFAVLAAYAFVFFSFPGKKCLFIVILCTMMIPQDTLVIANYRLAARLKLTDTYLGVCIVSFPGAAQLLLLRQAFRQSSRALRDAALLDGCGDARFLWRILVPATGPVITTLLLQVFVSQWNAYLWPLLVTNREDMRTIQVGITMLTNTEASNYEQILAGVTVALLPPFALFLVTRKYLAGGLNAGELAG